MWIADAHRGDGKRFVVRADEKLTAFLELERVTRSIHSCGFDKLTAMEVELAFWCLTQLRCSRIFDLANTFTRNAKFLRNLS
jgi:hypothetical protein